MALAVTSNEGTVDTVVDPKFEDPSTSGLTDDISVMKPAAKK